MKLKGSTILWTFIFCIFMGITVVSIGIGAAIPSINLIARPFVCPGGQMQNTSQVYTPSPIETVTTITWYCVDEKTGTQTELGIFPMVLYAGVIYGLLLFLLVLIGMEISARRLASNLGSVRNPGGADMAEILDRLGLTEQFHNTSAGQDQQDLAKLLNNSGSALTRMKELKGLRDANLISEAEYEQKREEILKNL